MIDPESHNLLKKEITDKISEDRILLDQLRKEIRPLKDKVRRIQPRTTTSISLVDTDGGNNCIEFDPFLVQPIRVVDSSNNEYYLEAITFRLWLVYPNNKVGRYICTWSSPGASFF